MRGGIVKKRDALARRPNGPAPNSRHNAWDSL